MRSNLFFALQLAVLAATPALADPAIVSELELDRRCSQCHDVGATPALGGEDWLARLHAMGPADSLTAAERSELVGFVRHHGWEVGTITRMAGERHLFEEKCSLCHTADRVFVRSLSPEQLAATVERMRVREPDWMSAEQAATIVGFLERGAPGVRRPEHSVAPDDAAGIFRTRCAVCHPLERSYLYLEKHGDEADWAPVIARMVARAPEWISAREAQLILQYLSSQEPLL